MMMILIMMIITIIHIAQESEDFTDRVHTIRIMMHTIQIITGTHMIHGIGA